MQKTIIFGAFAALLGLAAVAHADDRPPSDMRDGAGVTGPATPVAESGRRDGKHEREARRDRSREHEAGERQRETHEDHDGYEGAEHKRRR